MKRSRSDTITRDLVENLRRLGFSVAYVQGLVPGVTDLLVGRRGRTHLAEVKRLGGQLRPSQVAFGAAWRGCVHVVHSSFEAAELLEDCEKRNPAWLP